ncbi:MAG: O-acetylhomoserine aminocarboxypropyltransferase/cysteine synthase [Oscillospiraceae bacterium]|nr:O-acetylhomoserine aminocarboxypropyltransferase/cysteine synthase [Oscillospiraceae bacterium]
MNKNLKFETLQLHAGQEIPDPATDSRAVPLYLTTSFVFKDCQQAANRFNLSEGGNIYTRIMNPTTDAFEQRMAALEGGVGALATASGMSAVMYSIQNIACAGHNIVSDRHLYGGTYNLLAHTLPDLGIKTTFVNGCDPENFEKAIDENTRAIFLESLGNPNSDVMDIEKSAKIAHKHGIPLIVDNTFSTPFLLRPFEYGADIVVHSATKFIGGHGTVIGGVIVDSGKFDWAANDKFPGISKPNASYHGVVFSDAVKELAYIIKARVTLLRDSGACISPFNSFMLLQGLETLSLRVERHTQNALKAVEYLSAHPKIEKVNHPAVASHPDHALYKKYYPNGAGSIFTIEVKGGKEATMKFVDNLKLFSLLANVADAKSLVIHPATTTHSQLNEIEMSEQDIRPNTVRISIGIEHIDDIIADLEQALN